jgi:predicted DCC family thiol-disulfide oxidoreductase YuxK
VGLAAATAGPVVLYDGICGLCNRYLQFVIRHDRHARFRFAPLQGAYATAVLVRHGLKIETDPTSIVLVESPGTPAEKIRVRSDAVLTVVSQLGGAWRLFGALRVVPRIFRDVVYDQVARVRYRIFGRLDACPIPDASTSARFID